MPEAVEKDRARVEKKKKKIVLQNHFVFFK